jgi:curved DNA-binding protein CbpA
VEDAKQAYKDIVNVWHPDRFANNPRLRQRAEEKLKSANIAYEGVRAYLCKKDGRKHDHRASQDEGSKDKHHDFKEKIHEDGKIEAVFEVGTFFFLNACSHVYKVLRRFAAQQDSDEQGQPKPKE